MKLDPLKITSLVIVMVLGDLLMFIAAWHLGWSPQFTGIVIGVLDVLFARLAVRRGWIYQD